MITVKYDNSLNAVILEFAGRIGTAEMQELADKIQKGLPGNKKGFKVLTDLTDAQSVSPDISPCVKKLMEYLDSQGVTEIVRVIPDPAHDIGLGIMSLFHYSRHVTHTNFESRREADEALRH